MTFPLNTATRFATRILHGIASVLSGTAGQTGKASKFSVTPRTLTASMFNERQSTLFWGYVDVRGESECWLWTGLIDRSGYGSFRIGLGSKKNNPSFRSHRVAYALVNGSIPPGLYILHKCDTPACCNPSHLYAGTPADNSKDMVDRGRLKRPTTHPKLTAEDVVEIRKMRMDGKELAEIGAFFGVRKSHVWAICYGNAWGSVPNPFIGQLPKRKHLPRPTA